MTALTDRPNIQVLHDPSGNPAFAVLPWVDYLKLTTTSHTVDISQAVPASVVNAVFDEGYSPLKAWRRHLGLTQQQMADRLGISQAGYCQHENSDQLTPNLRHRCAEAMGLHAEQLNF